MFDPKVGLVIRYDFLWRDDAAKGLEHGKDRPCSIVVARRNEADNSHTVLLCPITHSPPSNPVQSVEIPPRVCAHLGLDEKTSWIKTDQINQVIWPDDRLPFGVTPVRDGEWTYGEMPAQLNRKALQQVRFASKGRSLSVTRRSHDNEWER